MDERGFIERAGAIERKLYRVARTILKNDMDCEDALQEALIRGWKHMNALKEEQYFDTWMTRILINECKRLLGSRTHNYEPLDDNIAAHDSPEPELWREVFALDLKYRLPVVLYYIEGYEVSEIAQMMRLPGGTVKRAVAGAQAAKAGIGGGEPCVNRGYQISLQKRRTDSTGGCERRSARFKTGS